MKDDLDKDKFSSLKEAYSYIERNALEFNRIERIADIFVHVRDSYQPHESQHKKAQLEINTFSFEVLFFENGTTYPVSLFDSKQYTEDELQYLKERVNAAQHPRLKSQYAKVLWNNPRTKHEKYAKILIDSNIKLVSKYLSAMQLREEKDFSLIIVASLKIALEGAKNIKDRTQDVKAMVLQTVKSFSENTKLIYVTKELISLMLSEKIFSKNDFIGMKEICETLSEKETNFSINFLEMAERIEKKIGIMSTKNWQELIGKKHVFYAEQYELSGYLGVVQKLFRHLRKKVDNILE